MRSVPAWVVYTVYRILMFMIPLGILLLLRIDPLLSTIIAAVIGLCLSYIFLRSPREAVAREIHAAKQRRKAPASSDDETEDAAIDRAATGSPEPGPASEREGRGEQYPVGQTGETGEFQGEDKLR